MIPMNPLLGAWWSGAKAILVSLVVSLVVFLVLGAAMYGCYQFLLVIVGDVTSTIKNS